MHLTSNLKKIIVYPWFGGFSPFSCENGMFGWETSWEAWRVADGSWQFSLVCRNYVTARPQWALTYRRVVRVGRGGLETSNPRATPRHAAPRRATPLCSVQSVGEVAVTCTYPPVICFNLMLLENVVCKHFQNLKPIEISHSCYLFEIV